MKRTEKGKKQSKGRQQADVPAKVDLQLSRGRAVKMASTKVTRTAEGEIYTARESRVLHAGTPEQRAVAAQDKRFWDGELVQLCNAKCPTLIQ